MNFVETTLEHFIFLNFRSREQLEVDLVGVAHTIKMYFKAASPTLLRYSIWALSHSPVVNWGANGSHKVYILPDLDPTGISLEFRVYT